MHNYKFTTNNNNKLKNNYEFYFLEYFLTDRLTMSKFYCIYAVDGVALKQAREYLQANQFSQHIICDTQPRPSMFPTAFKKANFAIDGITVAVCWVKPEHQASFIDAAVFHPELTWYKTVSPPKDQEIFCINYFIKRLGRARCGLPPIVEWRRLPENPTQTARNRLLSLIDDHKLQQPHDYKWTLDHRRLLHDLEVFDKMNGINQTVEGVTNPQDIMNPLADGIHIGMVPFKKPRNY